MELSSLLSRIVGPRPNGSAALERAADELVAMLREHTRDVEVVPFWGTPYGFALVWAGALLAAIAYALTIRRRPGAALGFALLVPLVLLAEFEWLRSPVSGLWPAVGRNIVATFPGRPGGPTVAFAAHYDTTTHFGDHYDWPRIGWGFGPATALALATAALAWRARRRGAQPSRVATAASATVLLLPAAGMALCQTLGPFVRTPSPGALDNAGSVTVLLRVAAALRERPAAAATTVRLVFFAGEEERALGSWRWAGTTRDGGSAPDFAVNLECVGAGSGLGWVPEDGFTFRRWSAPAPIVQRLDQAARELGLPPLVPAPLPPGALTDGRSLLAHGIPTVTLLPAGGIPRGLHSAADALERVHVSELEHTATLLLALLRRLDTEGEG